MTRPIVAVAVSALAGGAAPVALHSADVLYQVFDRVGQSRYLALFQSQDVRSVGPVADTAPIDLRLLAPMAAPVYAFVGGPTGFVAQVKPDVVTARSAVTAPGLFGTSGGARYTSTAALRASAPSAKPAPPGLFTFDSVPASAAKGVRKVTRLTLGVPGQPAQVWSWTGKLWAGPGGIGRINLAIETVPYKVLTPSHAASVSNPDVIGTGAATVLAGNLAVSGSWVRPAALQVTNYTDAGGVPFSFAPGASLILLVPAGTTVTLS